MRLTDDNMAEYKKHYHIPENYHFFREHYHFGTCPSFRADGIPPSEYLYVYTTSNGRKSATKVYRWAALSIILRDTWRPQSTEGRRWFTDNLCVPS